MQLRKNVLIFLGMCIITSEKSGFCEGQAASDCVF